MKYQRIIRFTWNSDSLSDFDFAVSNLCGLCRELAKIQIFQEHPEEEYKWDGKWSIPAEMLDSHRWLDWAIEYLMRLGHKVQWDEGLGLHGDETGCCTIELRGGPDVQLKHEEKATGFPLLLGYDSERWLINNLKVKK